MGKIKIIILLMALIHINLEIFGTEPTTLSHKRLVVWLSDGEKVYFDLNDNPQTSFSESGVSIETNMLKISYPFNHIIKYTYEDSSTDIVDLKANEMRVYMNENGLVFDNIKHGTLINIVTIDGKIIDTLKVDNGKNFTIPLNKYTNGVYLIKINNITYKILKQ